MVDSVKRPPVLQERHVFAFLHAQLVAGGVVHVDLAQVANRAEIAVEIHLVEHPIA